MESLIQMGCKTYALDLHSIFLPFACELSLTYRIIDARFCIFQPAMHLLNLSELGS